MDPDKSSVVKTKLGFDLQEFKGFIEIDTANENSGTFNKNLPTARDLTSEIDIKEKAALLAAIDLRFLLKKSDEVFDKWPSKVHDAMKTIQNALKRLLVAPPPGSPIEELRAHHIKVEVRSFVLQPS